MSDKTKAYLSIVYIAIILLAMLFLLIYLCQWLALAIIVGTLFCIFLSTTIAMAIQNILDYIDS